MCDLAEFNEYYIYSSLQDMQFLGWLEGYCAVLLLACLNMHVLAPGTGAEAV